MRIFFGTSLLVLSLSTASLMLAVSARAAPVVELTNCSIPNGGCAGQLGGGGCAGQCTDDVPGNDVACRCRIPPSGTELCICEAYDPWWGG